MFITITLFVVCLLLSVLKAHGSFEYDAFLRASPFFSSARASAGTTLCIAVARIRVVVVVVVVVVVDGKIAVQNYCIALRVIWSARVSTFLYLY